MAGTIAFGATQYLVGERSNSVGVTIQRTGDLSGSVSVDYVTVDDTAVAGADYGAMQARVTFAPGETRKIVSIPIINDALPEGNESFAIDIGAVSGGALGFPRTTRVVIQDDEAPSGGSAPDADAANLVVTSQTVATGLNQPIAFDWLPGQPSTMLVAQKGGVIKVLHDGVLRSAPLLDLSAVVNEAGDRGLLDIAVHPDFPSKPYLYAYYTVDPPETASHPRGNNDGPDGAGNRYAQLVRFTLQTVSGELQVLPGSATILLGGAGDSLSDISGAGAVNSTSNATLAPSGIVAGANLQDYIASDSLSHSAGGLAFGPDGDLYVTVGDGTSYSFADARSVRVQDIGNLSGKVLRIDPLTGDGIPDNPFFIAGDPDANQSKVYQLGVRNAFRLAFDGDGALFVGDVGWNSWEEIDTAGPGANFGWPYYEGGQGGVSLKTSQYMNLSQAQAFYSSGSPVAAPYQAFSHLDSAPGFPMQAIVLGDVYTGSVYPGILRDDLFFASLTSGQVFTMDTKDPSRTVSLLTTQPSTIVSMAQGPDGLMYYAGIDTGTIGRWQIDIVPYDLRVSLRSDRAQSVDLQSATLDDSVFVFVAGDTASVKQVTFSLDGKVIGTDRGAPWDFAGGNKGAAKPFDTNALPDGSHTISAVVTTKDGHSTTVRDTFTVDNSDGATPSFDLRISTSASRSPSADLQAATIKGDAFIFLQGSAADVKAVEFALDGTVARVDRVAPFDFGGDFGSSRAVVAFDTTTVADGQHDVTATVTFNDGRLQTIRDAFTVDNIL